MLSLRNRDTSGYTTHELQDEILKFVCENKNVDYDVLVDSLSKKRDRSVISRSAATLAERKMLKLDNIYKKNPRSKVYLKPTDKGTFYAVGRLGANYYKYITIYEPQYLKKFESMITDKTMQRLFFEYTAEYYLERGLFDNEGKALSLSATEEAEKNFNIFVKLVRSGQIDSVDILSTFKSKLGKEGLTALKMTAIDTSKKLQEFIKKLEEEGI